MVLSEQHATHKNVAFDVIGILLQHFFGQPLRFTQRRRGLLTTTRKVVTAQLDTSVQVVRIELGRLPHFVEGFLITLQAFVRLGQSPVRAGQTFVELQRVAKLDRGFLELFLFKQSLTAGHVLRFGFSRTGAGAHCQGDGE